MKLRNKGKREVISENKVEEDHAEEGKGKISAEARRLLDSSRAIEESRMEDNNKKMKLAFKIAGVFAVIAVAQAIAIASLAPMKTVVPYVLKVDNDTGHTSIERRFDPVEDSTQKMERFFLRLYVTSRESYDWYSVQSDFDLVKAMSSSAVYSRYSSLLRSEQGPLNVLGDNTRAVVDVKGVTFLGKSNSQKTVQIRFMKSFESMEGGPVPSRNESEWLATINFDYSDSKMNEKEKNLNPLNLRVTSYRLDRLDGGDGDD